MFLSWGNRAKLLYLYAHKIFVWSVSCKYTTLLFYVLLYLAYLSPRANSVFLTLPFFCYRNKIVSVTIFALEHRLIMARKETLKPLTHGGSIGLRLLGWVGGWLVHVRSAYAEQTQTKPALLYGQADVHRPPVRIYLAAILFDHPDGFGTGHHPSVFIELDRILVGVNEHMRLDHLCERALTVKIVVSLW